MSYYNKKLADQRLKDVHPRLAAVIRRAVSAYPLPVQVVEGLRDPERQRVLFREGKSQTFNSLHLRQTTGYAHAVDLVVIQGGIPRWEEADAKPLADFVKETALKLETPIEWGGDWRFFVDSPHFQLPRGMFD